MKAAIQERYGPPEVVRVVDVPDPVPTGDQVLLRIRAASVNRADLDGLGPRPGFVRAFIGIRRPRHHATGIDAAGVVEAVGPDVTRFKVGDRVFGDLYGTRSGAFAELATAAEARLQPIPGGVGFEEAATLPHSAILAVQGLRQRDGSTIRAGDRVLVDGASGNVGPFAVQIARASGAHVTGTSHPSKVDFVRDLGADEALAYTEVDYTRTGRQWDWIVDTDSHHPPLAVRRALAPGGTYVTLGGTTRPILRALLVAPIVGRATGRRMGLMWWWKPFHAPDVERVLGLIADGAVRPRIDRSFPLSRVVDALRWVDDGKARGKVLVIPD